MAQPLTAWYDRHTSSHSPRIKASFRGLLKGLALFTHRSAPQECGNGFCKERGCPGLTKLGIGNPSGRPCTIQAELPPHLVSDQPERSEVYGQFEVANRSGNGAAREPNTCESATLVRTGVRQLAGCGVERHPQRNKEAATRFVKDPHGAPLTAIFEETSPCASRGSLIRAPVAVHSRPILCMRRLGAQESRLEAQDNIVLDADELALYEFRGIWHAAHAFDAHPPSPVADRHIDTPKTPE